MSDDQLIVEDGFVVRVHSSCTSPIRLFGVPPTVCIVMAMMVVAVGMGFHAWWYVFFVLIPLMLLFRFLGRKEPYWFDFMVRAMVGKPKFLEV